MAGAWRGLLAFAIGAMAAGWLPTLPPWPLWWVLLAGFALALTGSRWWPPLAPVAWLVLGLVWFTGHAHWQLDQQWPQSRTGEAVTFTATVRGLPESRGQRTRILVAGDSASRRAEGVPARMLLSWYRPREYFRSGERWRITARLEPPAGRINPGAFDYHRFLLSRGVGATGRIDSAVRLAPGVAGGVAGRLRQRLGEWLQATTVDLDAAALHRALTVADRSAMDPERSQVLRRTGTAHLLAISGLHVGMVAGLAGLLAALLVTPLLSAIPGLDRRRVALVVGLIAAAGYAALAGFTLPTRRALIMLGVAAGAVLWRRTLRPGHALVLALAAVLVADPMAPLAAGFWLSFSAVAVLVWTFAWRTAGSGWLVGLVRAQVLIAIGLLPLNAGMFQQLIPVALAANLVAIPLVGLWVLPLLLVAMALFMAGLPADWAVAASEAGLVWLMEWLHWLDGLPVGHWAVAGASWPVVAAAMLGGLWLLAPPGWPARWLGGVLILPLLWPAGRPVPASGFEMWLADVGDGLAAVVRTADEVVLFDTGPGDGAGRDQVDSSLVPLLRRTGAGMPDRVVVSNPRAGHAGGLASVQSTLVPERIDSAIPGLGNSCRAGHHWQSGGVTFRYLHPAPGLPDLGADSSCVLEVRSPHGAVLLTGGMGRAVARRLVDRGLARSTEVVVLPRSGNRRALADGWLEALAPQWALVSVSRYNRWSLPHRETLERVEALGGRPVSTGRCGAVRVRIGEGGVAVTSMARMEPRFWRSRGDCP